MATATFNSQALGDALASFSTGNIRRSIVDQQLFGTDGHATRNRGGGKQTLSVTCYKHCGTTFARAAYLVDLYAACGNAKGTLVLALDGQEKTFPDCLCESVREIEAAGPYVRFAMTFVRSAL